VEILAQSSTAFVLTHNFQGTHILGTSRGYLSDSVASCLLCRLCLLRVINGTAVGSDFI